MNPSRIEALRHLEVFSPTEFGERRIDVVGLGATGSRIMMSLAKLGLVNLHGWDHDTVEEHNIANQIYGLGDVGKLKVDAAFEHIKGETATEIIKHAEEVNGSQGLGEIVFLLTDTMASRKAIWDNALKFKLHVKLVIETRMDADNGRVYTINPSQLEHVKQYEETLYTDEVAATSACGAATTVGPTAELISGFAVWQMIRWFNIQQGKGDALDNEFIFSVRPYQMFSRTF